MNDLESRLEQLAPRGLSNDARDRCHETIDSLIAGLSDESDQRGSRYPRFATAAAAMVALGTGIGGGWYLGVRPDLEAELSPVANVPEATGDFDQLDREAWVITDDIPKVYVTEDGQIREIVREVEVTKEVVKHRKSGVVVTVETTDHHVVDSEISEF